MNNQQFGDKVLLDQRFSIPTCCFMRRLSVTMGTIRLPTQFVMSQPDSTTAFILSGA